MYEIMLLGVTTALATILWRFIEEPGSQWQFLFGIYALLVGKFIDVKW